MSKYRMEEPFYHCYREHKFTPQVGQVIEKIIVVIDDMREQGYVLSLRQLFYQFVRRNWIRNAEKEYKRLGRILTKAREAGVVDWRAIEDRGRQSWTFPDHSDAAALVKRLWMKLNVDPWLTQPKYVEIWIEKQALESVLERPCAKWQAPYMSCKGYLSASEAWRAGRRFKAAVERGKEPVLIHLADHDPSGIDMTSDNRDRLRMFAEHWGVEVRRIALNMDQIEEHKPPPNPAKVTDSRYASYVDKHGEDSWELDALEPAMLDGLISGAVEALVDKEAWAEAEKKEKELQVPLRRLGHHWPDVAPLLMRLQLTPDEIREAKDAEFNEEEVK